ncbi:peptidase inhibitor I78 [Phenylobacterium sp.]|uniref:peptidase inhibitor I78 n=1 Tax=Phenylobacterium sp. TaxID=1871053 RepID=UPI002B55763D|nr:peptidase inhibitor I78 [Phenylobacterium sp.]HVI30891.1 peptidase inhibitor I78 [Phenylobacterium sp.]
MRIRLAVLGALLAAGCAAPPAEAPPPPAAAPPRAAPAPPPPRDRCGAAELQHLVGRPRSEIPVPVRPERQRVACTTCPVTQDFSPERLNFFFDAQTGIIREIRCG